ncbi:MAG: hypothetical protein JNK82_35090 [Myxococcaceae bacterium]|nr:hypothetical protein [Myxococcaceae bacterium]
MRALGLVCLAACACTSARLQIGGGLKVTAPTPVVVLDARPEVVSGNMATSRTGVELAAGGVTSPRLTKGAVPLAHQLVSHLKELRYEDGELFIEREVLPSADPAVARFTAAPRDEGEQVGLLFVVHVWEATVVGQVRSLKHDVSLEVIDASKRVVASSRTSGNGDVAFEELPANAEILSKLLNEPPIVEVLSRPPAATGVASGG